MTNQAGLLAAFFQIRDQCVGKPRSVQVMDLQTMIDIIVEVIPFDTICSPPMAEQQSWTLPPE